MKVEYHDKIGPKPYYTVLVEKDELELPNGKKLPFSTWLGTINYDGSIINLWIPAGYCPRGYRKAAMKVLEQVAQEIKEGKHEGQDHPSQ